MSDLPEVRPLATTLVAGEDLASAFQGLEPGWYRTADLLPRYLAWAGKSERPGVTAKVLGEAITRTWPETPRRKVSGGVSAWWLDEKTLTHRAWFK